MTKKLTKRQREFLKIYKANAGNVSKSCENGNLGRATFYKWQKDSEAFRNAVQDMDESLIDNTEAKLITLINGVPMAEEIEVKDPNTGKAVEYVVYEKPPSIEAIKVHLEAKAKHRGYGKSSLDLNITKDIDVSKLSDEELLLYVESRKI